VQRTGGGLALPEGILPRKADPTLGVFPTDAPPAANTCRWAYRVVLTYVLSSVPSGRDNMTDFQELERTKDVPALIAALKDENPNIRTRAAESLGRLADARAIEPLTAAVADQHPNVHRSAKKALINLKFPEEKWLESALNRLEQIYLQRPSGFDRDIKGDLEEEIRLIGELINERGGIELMRTAWREFKRRSHARASKNDLAFSKGCVQWKYNLDVMWHLIGYWREYNIH
jgi:HEAT repeats